MRIVRLAAVAAIAAAIEVLPGAHAFVIPQASCAVRPQQTTLKYRQDESSDVNVGPSKDFVGHSPDDERHYADKSESKRVEDAMISEAFGLMDDIMAKAEEEATDAVMDAATDAFIDGKDGKRKKVKILNVEDPPLASFDPKDMDGVTPVMYGAAKPMKISTIRTKKADKKDKDGKDGKNKKEKESGGILGWWSSIFHNGDGQVQPDEQLVLSAVKPSTIKYAPDAAMTGVEERYTRLCAAVSGQIYSAKSVDDFNVDSDMFHKQPKVIWFNDHGDLAETTPTMVAVIVDDKMIVGWRGSKTLMDWINDFAFSPVSSSRFHHIGESIRVQGAYSALIESDMALYEENLRQEIEDNNIKELIFTGHSLAGGIANVAHIMIAGERLKRLTEWNRSKTLRDLSVRSIAFSPPMTSVLLDRQDVASRTFLQETIGSKTCNIVYKTDPVPRGYADLDFISDMIRTAFEETTSDMSFLMRRGANIASLFLSGYRLKGSANKLFKEQVAKHADLIRVAARFQHQGKIVHYDSADSEPKVYIDKGSFFKKPRRHTVPLFRDLKYTRPEESKKKDVSVLDVAGDYHNFLVTGPGQARCRRHCRYQHHHHYHHKKQQHQQHHHTLMTADREQRSDKYQLPSLTRSRDQQFM